MNVPIFLSLNENILEKMKEQEFISFFYKKLSSGALSNTDIRKADKLFPNSPILAYYTGYYYDEKDNREEATKYFKKCLSICPNFTHPLFHMGNYYNTPRDFLDEYEEQLSGLLNKKTLNPFTGKQEYRISDQLHICEILANSSNRYTDDFERVFLRFEAKPEGDDDSKVIRGYKNLCIALSTSYLEYANQPEKAIRYLLSGFKYHHPEVTDIPLLKRVNIIKNFVLLEPTLPRTAEEIFNETVTFTVKKEPPNIKIPSFVKEITTPRDGKINVGYISPDFNKSACGLFSTVLLKYYNKQKFNVFTYYACKTEDIFTPYFKNYDTNWFDISRMTDEEAYELIHSHHLDILVDLSVFCVDSRIDLIVKKPAKIIINYIGYPNTANLTTYDYRLVDSITDPPAEEKKSNEYTEKLIRLPRCFLCYHLFENVVLPEIRSRLSPDDPITILITSRFGKFGLLIVRAWEKIFSTIPNMRLIIKSEINQDTSKVIDDNEILSKHVIYLPFVHTLEEFFEYHNLADFCLDPFPYSSTTVTCSSLLMGKPIFTTYQKTNPHRSNVTSSILKTCGEEYEQYISSSLEDYSDRIIQFCKNKNNISKLREGEYSKKIREDFIKAMEPRKWMLEYEELISHLVY
jgi:tetratricopeptide (TPR) repeat protein